MADRPVVTIPVDSSEFDEFLKKWDKFQDDLKNQAGAWAAGNAQAAQMHANFANAANTFSQMAGSAAAAAQAMHGFNQASHGAATATTQINQNLNNSQTIRNQNQATKNTAQNAKNWLSISKSAAVTSRWMTSISRMSIASGLFKMGGAAVKGAVAGYTTAALAYNNLSNVNKDSRRLGMSPGQIQAFEDVYGPAGGSRDLLAKMAEAKNDPTVGQPLAALGITQQDIKSNDPEKLAAMFLERSGKAFNKMGAYAGLWAHGVGLDNFASTEDMRLAGSYAKQPGAFDKMAQQYQTTYDKVKVEQDAADAATEFTKALKAAKDELENNFGAALKPLAPKLVEFTQAAADWVKWASQTDFAKDSITQFGVALEKITAWIKSRGATWDWGKVTHDQSKPLLTTGANNKPWTLEGWWTDFKNGFKGGSKNDQALAQQNRALQRGEKADASDYMDGETGQFTGVANKDKYFGSLDDQQGLPAGMMQGIENNESHGGDARWLIGRKTKYGRAMGPFQMLKDAARRFGVHNRFNEQEAAEGAAKYLNWLRMHYSGDAEKAAAGYNWGEGNLDKLIAKDTAAGKDWHEGLPKETQEYLKKLKEQGVDFDGNMKKAQSDPTLKPGAQKLNEDDFKVIDLSSEGKTGMGARETTEAVSLGVLSGLQRFYATYFRDGGGAQFRSKEKSSSSGSSAQTRPAQVTVKVHTPAGASTNVTQGGIPQ